MELLSKIWKLLGENASELIALAALGLAIWQGFIARRHNKLSVRPHLSFTSCFLDEDPHFSIDLTNDGLGTAIITNYKVQIDGVTQPDTGKNFVIDACRKLDIPNRKSSAGRYFSNGDSIAAGSTMNLIKIVLKNDSFLERHSSYKELDRIQLIIQYKSLYGVSYEAKFHST